MSEPYTITQADVDGCRQILAQLQDIDTKLGGFRIGNVQGHTKSATATVHYNQGADPFTTAGAVDVALNSVASLGLLCKKLIAHAETHPEAVSDG